MKRSEKILLSLFAIIFVVLVGGGLTSMAVKSYTAVTEETELLEKRLATMTTTVAQGAEWQKRAEWVEAHVPKFGSENEAAGKLQEIAKKEAASAGLKPPVLEMLPKPVAQEGDPTGYFDKASVKLTFTDASEEQLYKWMHSLYKLRSFIGVTRLSMTPNAQGKSVNAEVDLTQFYHEAAAQKLSRAN